MDFLCVVKEAGDAEHHMCSEAGMAPRWELRGVLLLGSSRKSIPPLRLLCRKPSLRNT